MQKTNTIGPSSQLQSEPSHVTIHFFQPNFQNQQEGQEDDLSKAQIDPEKQMPMTMNSAITASHFQEKLSIPPQQASVESLQTKKITFLRDHVGNQSTDIDDIAPQFKSNQQQLAQQKNGIKIHKHSDANYFSSESDDQLVRGLVQNKANYQAMNADEQKQAEEHDTPHNLNQQESGSSSPSSTSSEDEKTQKKQDSDSSEGSSKIQKPHAVPVSTQDPEEGEKQTMPQNLHSPPKHPEDQAQPQLMPEEVKRAKVPEEDVKQTSSDSEVVDYDEDDDPGPSMSSIVLESSPKGRFNRFGEELGRGAYKIVYRGIDNETGREIAWNVINLKRLPKQDKFRIKSEIDLIKKLEHKNIIHFISAWVNKEKEQVIFITEMITGGSLRKYVKKIKHPRLRVIKTWCMEILQGLVYLHDQKPFPIIHRDLKCDNIFINSNSGEIKIGDLGLSTPMQRSYTTSVLGTPEFMAPELYEECYGTGVDIYAFGMCVLEMITLERPYKECQNPAQIYNKVIRGIRPNALDRIEDEEIKDFILYCLAPVERRPTAKQLLESRFLKDLESEKNNKEVKVKPNEKSKFPKRKRSIDYLKKNGSTIIEEEEENSEDEEEQQQTVKEGQDQKPSEVIKVQPLNQEDMTQAQDEVQVKEEEEKDKSQIAQSAHQDDHQPSPTTPQQEEPSLDHNQSSNLTVEANETEEQKLRKKKKSGSRNKKLNESVIFLKKIDKSKQQKMQERTRLEQNEQSGDSGKEEEKLQENILGELLQQERELEKMKYEQAILEQSQNPQMTYSASHSYTQNKSDNETIVTVGLQKQLPNVSQYDSSDYNKVSPKPLLLNNATNALLKNSNENHKKEKKDANMFSKSKNFKEDNKQLPVMAQQKPAIPKPQGQNAISNTGTMSDDLQRTTSKEISLPNLSSEQNLRVQLPQGQVPDQKVSKQYQHHQSSDSHLSSHSTTQPAPTNQKPSKSGFNQPENSVHPLESLFDVQSQSGDDSQHNDSEVENIQLPKNQTEDANAQSSNAHSNPSTPYNDNAVGAVQVRISNEGLNHKNQLKKAGTTKQLNNQQSSGHSFSQNQQSQSLQTIKSQNQSQSQIVQSQSQQQINKQNQQEQKTNITKLPQVDSKSQINRSSAEKQGILPQQQQQQQIGRSSTGLTQYNPTQKPYQQQVYLHSSARVEDKPYLHHITFKVRSHDGTQDKEVFFEFDVRNDTAKGVAEEMVRELQLPPSQIEVIDNLISSIVSEPQKPQPQVRQEPPAQIKQSDTPVQQQPQSKKDSPQKISKDTANTYFSKLFEHIDQFFVYMQSKSITSIDEITEAMDLPLEEAQMRAQFLNQVLQAKRSYKRSMEEYKKKKEKKKQQIQQQPPESSSQQQQQQPIKPNKQVVQEKTQQAVQPLNLQKTQSSSQQQNQSLKKQPDSTLKRVGSKQDMVATQQYEERKYEEKKELIINKELYVPVKITINIPVSIRKYFKVAPSSVVLHQKFSKVLKQVPESPVSPDEEVQSLQNALNIIFEALIIEMNKNPSNENSPAIQNYLPLRVDGYFGEKTEASLLKFQRRIKVPEDGIVTEQLWVKILAYIDFILKEDIKVHSQQQLQEKQLQQLQQQQIVTQSSLPQHQMQKDSQQPTNSKLQTVQQVTTIATQVQLINTGKPNKSSQHLQIQTQKSMTNQLSHSQGQHQKGLSPTKHPARRMASDTDYQYVIEQAFRQQDSQDELDNEDM